MHHSCEPGGTRASRPRSTFPPTRRIYGRKIGSTQLVKGYSLLDRPTTPPQPSLIMDHGREAWTLPNDRRHHTRRVVGSAAYSDDDLRTYVYKEQYRDNIAPSFFQSLEGSSPFDLSETCRKQEDQPQVVSTRSAVLENG